MNTDAKTKILKKAPLPIDILLKGEYDCSIRPRSAYGVLDRNHQKAITETEKVMNKKFDNLVRRLDEFVKVNLHPTQEKGNHIRKGLKKLVRDFE